MILSLLLFSLSFVLSFFLSVCSLLLSGILAKDGVVLAADKMVTSKLLDPGKSREKIYRIDAHITCAVAGLTADANLLIAESRFEAQSHRYHYNEPEPLEQLIVKICDIKQSYTQFGGLRPFGASFLFAGYDSSHGFQLYHTDPAGNYSGWKATAIGVNNQSAQSILKQEWKEDLTIEEAKQLAAKVLTRTIDSTAPSPEKVEFATVMRDSDGKVVHRYLPIAEVSALLAAAAAT